MKIPEQAARFALITALGIGCASSGMAQDVNYPDPAAQVVDDPDQLRPSGRTIERGETLAGSLSHRDYIIQPDESYVQVWELTASGGEAVTVDLLSDDFDAVMMIDGHGLRQFDDDGAGFCNARLTFTPPATGTYRVIVGSLQSGATGDFVLRVTDQPGPRDPRSCLGADFEDPGLGPVLTERLEALPHRSRPLEIGLAVEASFRPESPVIDFDDDPRHAHSWGLELTAGQEVAVDVYSDDFDAYLYVLGPGIALGDDDCAGDLDPRLTFVAPESGTYRVIPSTLFENETGDYTVYAYEPDMAFDECRSADVTLGEEVNLRGRPVVDELNPGDVIESELTRADDSLDNGSYVRVWSLRGPAGESVSVALASDEFDTYLWIETPDGEILADDDGWGNCNSLLRVTLDGGSYLVGASSFSDDAIGNFSLGVYRTAPVPVRGWCTSSTEEDTRAVLEELDPRAELHLGEEHAGSLMTGQPEVPPRGYVETFTFTGERGDEIVVEAVSTDLDTYLWVWGEDLMLSDDDGAGNCNSRISMILPYTGSYGVAVSTFAEGTTGEYRVRLVSEPSGEEEGGCNFDSDVDFSGRDSCVRQLLLAEPTGELRPGDSVESVLDEEAMECDNGEPLEVWTIQGVEGQRLFIDMTSVEFDTYLFLDGQQLESTLTDDDSGGACNARLSVVFPATDTYRIGATAFSGSAVGTYELRVSETEPPIDTGPCPGNDMDLLGGVTTWDESAVGLLPLRAGQVIRVGQSRTGRLSENDFETEHGALAQAWAVSLSAGAPVTVELSSPDFDTYLVVSGPGLQDVLTDDDSGGNLDSRIRFTPVESGAHTIVVTSFAAGSTGAFTLSVRRDD